MTCFRLSNGKTVRQWCKENGVSYKCVYERLDKGLDIEESCKQALANKGNKRHNVKYLYNGKPFTDTFPRTSTEYRRTMSRISRGWTFEEALCKKTFKNAYDRKKERM